MENGKNMEGDFVNDNNYIEEDSQWCLVLFSWSN